MNRRFAIKSTILAFGVAAAAACAPMMEKEPDIVDIAVSNGNFNTLVAAVTAAGLVDTLKSEGPFTVFAPTDAAFAALPEGTVENPLKPENKKTLAFILTNHVAPANYPEKQLKKEAKKGRKLYMASGKYLEVKDTEEGLFVGGTKILKTVRVSNGWIHVIADVLVPED